MELFSLGHSTHSLADFVSLLARHNIELLADIRRYPASRRLPHFNRENLQAALAEAGVDYRWIEALGGRRGKPPQPSRNLGLRDQSFRNYADYMATEEFQSALRGLLDEAGRLRTAMMCSEGLFWQCHRRLVSDQLTAIGVPVRHIMPAGDLRPHSLTRGAVVEGGAVAYPDEDASQGKLFS